MLEKGCNEIISNVVLGESMALLYVASNFNNACVIMHICKFLYAYAHLLRW